MWFSCDGEELADYFDEETSYVTLVLSEDSSSEGEHSSEEEVKECAVPDVVTVSGDRRWTEDLTPVSIVPFTQPVGPVHVQDKEKRETDFFNLLFSEEMFELIARETNQNAARQQSTQPNPKWTPTSAAEVKAFLGMQMFMSIVALPRYRMYWALDEVYGNFFIRNIMPRDRFEKILQYFNLNDCTTNPAKGQSGHDKLIQVRPVFDSIVQACKAEYLPHRDVVVDEAMIGFRGRLAFKQYMPQKHRHYGIKVWVLADSHNGYVSDFQIYTGKVESGTEQGFAERIVKELTQGLKGKAHHVHFNNFFTSTKLMEDLLQSGIYSCGTVRINHQGWPLGLNGITAQKQKCGWFKQYQCSAVLGTVWMDRQPVFLLSTNTDPTEKPITVSRTRKDCSKEEVVSPVVLSNYNMYMNGVDIADQLRTQYPSVHKSNKWWHYIFWFLWDLSIVNAYVLYKESPNHMRKNGNGKVMQCSQLDFKIALSKQLMEGYRPMRKRKSFPHPNPAMAEGGHWPAKAPKRRCKNCSSKKIRADSSYACSTCQVNLCVKCFKEYHESKIDTSIPCAFP